MPEKPEVLVVEAMPEHDAWIGDNMRQADIDECWASALLRPLQAVRVSRETSSHAWTGLINGEPACMFGVSPASVVSGYGVPWLLGTEVIVKYSFAFIRECRQYVDVMFAEYPRLTNYVDERNKVSQRWLRWLGFEMAEPEIFGPLKKPFRRFDMRRDLPCAIQLQ